MQDEHRASYYDQPSYTMVPNQLLDFDVAELSGCELKALLYIVRHTLGYGKTTDDISYRQMLEGIPRRGGRPGEMVDLGCGVKSRSRLAAALGSLERRGCIVRERCTTRDGDPDITRYRLSVQQCDDSPQPAGRQRGVVPKSNYPPGGVVPKSNYGSAEIELGVVPKSNYGSAEIELTKENVTKENLQKKTEQGACGAAAPHRAPSGLEMVSTEDDEGAADAARLALRLAGDVLDCPTVAAARLERYEAFCAGLLAQGYTSEELCIWMDWMSSGESYWAGKARFWKEDAMLGDLESWESDGRPAHRDEEQARG